MKDKKVYAFIDLNMVISLFRVVYIRNSNHKISYVTCPTIVPGVQEQKLY